MNKFYFPLLLCFSMGLNFLWGQIRLPRFISDGVVFQREAPLKIWGWAAPQEAITLQFKGATYTTQADNQGNWNVVIAPQAAGGPYEMLLQASNQRKLKDIMIGDLWICSGQSNMELPMDRVKEKYPEIVRTANNPMIRQFIVPDLYDFNQVHNDFEQGDWVAVSPESISQFSAVAYFFAQQLQEKYQVPIGIVNVALGGSPVEAWMSEAALKAFPDAWEEMQQFKDTNRVKEIQAADQKRSAAWYRALDEKDRGLQAQPQWSTAAMDDSDWDPFELPNFWNPKPLDDTQGVVWFRKKFIAPPAFVDRPLKLMMGRIVDQDFVYLNGKLVGTTGYQYPPRRYTVENGILQKGENTLAVRVINTSGRGGFILDKPYYLATDQDTLDLKGQWKYRLGAPSDPLAGPTFVRWKAGGLYNKMLAPLLPYKIKGCIWYQGESNVSRSKQYAARFAALINNWRTDWGQGDFPFLFVQLANFLAPTHRPVESDWAALRQAQWETTALPNTGMAVAIDLGEWNDIHPLNKADVGKRLALLAEKIAYGDTTLEAESPAPEHWDFEQKQVLIRFSGAQKGLFTKGGPPASFAIRNAEQDFVWAKAQIDGHQVRVWHPEIENPTVVRYAWANNPENANLYALNGLPATPFEIKKTSPQ